MTRYRSFEREREVALRSGGRVERRLLQTCTLCWKDFPRDEMTWVSLFEMECQRCFAIPKYERRFFNPLSANKSYQAEGEAYAHGTCKNGVWATSYKHEELSRDFANRLGPKPKKADLKHEGVLAFVERVQRSRWWKSKVRIRIDLDTNFRVKSNSWSWGFTSTKQIKLASDHYNRWIVCHELAHVIAYQLDGHNGHGREWRRWYVLLVDRFIGKIEADLLKNSFRRRNLKFSARRKLSPEARRAAAERLSAMRRSG